MHAYLNEEFFRTVGEELHQYSTDYKKAIERSDMFDKQERDRLSDLEKSYEILEHFGVLI